MPIYEYCCDACGHQFELLQKVSDEPKKQCPNCDAMEAKRLVSATSFRLKGSGWYETDFKNPKKPASQTTEKNKSDKPAAAPAAANKESNS